MRYISAALVLMVALMPFAPAAHAIPMTFGANLSGANEVPAVASPGTGVATIVLDPTAQTIQISVTFSGLTSPVTMAHIHCCAPLGTNAPVATTVPAFQGFPLGAASGNYPPTVFDLTQPLIYNPAFVTARGGSLAQAEADLIAGIQNGQTYFNIHTTMNGGGEIRGQLSPVPEPNTVLLSATTLVILGAMYLRRRKGKRAALAAATFPLVLPGQ